MVGVDVYIKFANVLNLNEYKLRWFSLGNDPQRIPKPLRPQLPSLGHSWDWKGSGLEFYQVYLPPGGYKYEQTVGALPWIFLTLFNPEGRRNCHGDLLVLLFGNWDTHLPTALRAQVLLGASWKCSSANMGGTDWTLPPLPLCPFVNPSDFLFNKHGLHI